MTQDQTERMNQKLTPLVEQWILKNRQRPKGIIEGDKFFVEIKDMPPEIQEPWQKMLKASTEDLIKQGNSQIRETKKRESLTSAKGLILIANPGNPYHNVPEDYRRLMAEVLRKRTQSGGLRFDNIHGGVYFSVAHVKSRKEQMYFWANLQMKRTPDDDVTGSKSGNITGMTTAQCVKKCRRRFRQSNRLEPLGFACIQLVFFQVLSLSPASS